MLGKEGMRVFLALAERTALPSSWCGDRLMALSAERALALLTPYPQAAGFYRSSRVLGEVPVQSSLCIILIEKQIT